MVKVKICDYDSSFYRQDIKNAIEKTVQSLQLLLIREVVVEVIDGGIYLCTMDEFGAYDKENVNLF